jgi:hypothetical protein
MSKDEIYTFIETHLPIINNLKKDFGEVFTCTAFINKMLDQLPHEVWSNPGKTWLEPCCGVGNFMAIVYLRLMDGLAGWEPDSQLRSNHIIQNMLYMVELNPRNVEICSSLFSVTNIVCCDFLTWCPNKSFDIIVSNLPFQSKSCLGGKNKLYEKIMDKCLDMFIDYILVITPDNIFSGGSKLYRKMINNHSVLLIDLDKSNQQFFLKIQQYICYFLVRKSHTDCLTKIICNDGSFFSVKLLDRSVNPVRNWNMETENLIRKYISNTKNNIVYNRGRSIQHYGSEGGSNDDTGVIALIYTPTKFLYTNDESFAIGYGIKKIVIFCISVKMEFKLDLDGEYGVGPNTFYIPLDNNNSPDNNSQDNNSQDNNSQDNNSPDNNNSQKWIKFLESDDYKTMVSSTKTNRQFLKNTFIQHLNI